MSHHIALDEQDYGLIAKHAIDTDIPIATIIHRVINTYFTEMDDIESEWAQKRRDRRPIREINKEAMA